MNTLHLMKGQKFFHRYIVDQGELFILANLAGHLEQCGDNREPFDAVSKEYMLYEAKRLLAAIEALPETGDPDAV